MREGRSRGWLRAAGRWGAAGTTAGALLGALNWAAAFAAHPFSRAWILALILLGASVGLLAGAGLGLLVRLLSGAGAVPLPARRARAGASSRRASVALRLSWVVLVGAGLTALAAYLGSAPRFAGLLSDAPRTPATLRSGPPNVILVSLDTVRPDHLGAYDRASRISPQFDRLAGRGVLFRRCVTTFPRTGPSHASLLTGVAPSRLGSGGIRSGRPAGAALPHDAVTLAETLRSAGYHTAAFIGGAPLGAAFGFDQGFDLFNDRLPPTLSGASGSIWCARPASRLLNLPSARLLRFLDPPFIALSNFLYQEAQRLPSDRHLSFMAGADRKENAADEVNQKVFAWLDRRPPHPFFLFVHYFDAHDPYDPPAAFAPEGHDPAAGFIGQNGLAERVNGGGEPLGEPERERLVAAYDGEIAAVDHHLGLLLDRLDAEGALNNAILGVVSDHGESFGEHGLLSHGHHLYDEQTRVVFLLAGHGVPASAREVATAVSTADVAPTLLDLAGLQPPAPVDGRSLKPLLEGSPSEPRPVYAELFGGREAFPACRPCAGTAFSMEVDGLKMIRAGSGSGVLFDLAADPGERTDLSSSRPDEAGRLRRLLAAYVAALPAGLPPDEDARE